MDAVTAPTLTGPRVILRAFTDADVAARQRHGWHREIERGYGSDRETGPMTDAEARAWVSELADREARGATCWAVEAGGELAGAVFLSDVREAGRKARLAVGLYAPPLLGRGIGREAIGLVLRHAFGTLGMHRVDLLVLADNARAIAAYRACGFVEEGRQRESCFVDGSWHDDVVMGVLDREFAALDPDPA
jgi:[ribosomal protein S5]-alanine N-acetyltransferase